jgi:hypothetical protein
MTPEGEEAPAMKYMLLAYTNSDDWDATDFQSPEFLAMCEFYEKLTTELTETGELVCTEGLTHPALTKTVRKTAEGLVVADGPYAESKEVLASFSILDCATHERLMEIVGRIVDAVGDTVEVRPVEEGTPGG